MTSTTLFHLDQRVFIHCWQSRGSIPPPSISTISRTSAVTTKQRGLRVPTPGTTTKLTGSDGDIDQTGSLTRTAQSSTDIRTTVATERILPPKQEIKPPLSQTKTITSMHNERIKEINDKLQQQEHELKETRDKFTTYRDEMTDTEVRIQSLTLDLEMAEEKFETLTLENITLKEKFEEVQLELDVIKGEIQLNGPNQVPTDIQQKIDDERTINNETSIN
ncbi:unnamed protein product [Rotaria sp. Silwood1]|nr:unnamed protein product [Rotaria sp. Silwood1]CAF1383508.1 unnamed protein product [Rotaria sp. Silwood1]CAF1390461.1 unnamed protein product [Rotaria sp. Silwood1]CAF3712312.1 unnamed protein product [Rotaria sp. Silwood1]CAF4718888.1 unnamed protein product [Rotaria sp. Silwood1]